MIGRWLWLMSVVVIIGLGCGDSVPVLALCCCRPASVITPKKKPSKPQVRRPPTPAVKHDDEVFAKQEAHSERGKANDSIASPPPHVEMLSPTSVVDTTMVVAHFGSDTKTVRASSYGRWSKESMVAEEQKAPTDEAKAPWYMCVETSSLLAADDDIERYALLVLPNGNLGYLFAGRDGVTIVDRERNKQVVRLLHDEGTCYLPIATTLRDGRFVMVLHGSSLINRDQKMLIYDETLNGKPVFFEDRVSALDGAYFSSWLERICAMAVCPNGLLVTGSPGGTIKVWAPRMLCCQQTVASCTFPFIPSVARSADGGQREYSVGEEYVCSITALSNTYVAYGLYDGTIKLLNLINGAKKTLGACHYGAVTALATLSDDTFASASSDRMIKIWQTDDGMGVGCIQVLKGHRGGIISLVARKTKKGSELISLATDGEIKVWRIQR